MPWPITQEGLANWIVERAEETNAKMSIQGESQSHTRYGSPRELLFLSWSETSVHYLERVLSVWVRFYDLLNGSGIVLYLELFSTTEERLFWVLNPSSMKYEFLSAQLERTCAFSALCQHWSLSLVTAVSSSFLGFM